MARKRRPTQTETYWDQLTIMIPSSFPAAAEEAAHRYGMALPEYCRQALLLRLAADGVRLEDFVDAAA